MNAEKLGCYRMGCKSKLAYIAVFNHSKQKQVLDIQIVGYCKKHYSVISKLDIAKEIIRLTEI